ncbi:GntP family permease [Pseudomonas fluorescens]|uniref:GntP family permease n=1 Tax=Pseudomonas fluorescens TaxID=294 RepID=A0A944DKN2_PSEFL|nr:gluconate:H+ symporter [Pseudomonas fluorescens]MBT2297546.1 GntP family permease [Pseudomonas fluorescens]MBT2305744.1 GntP family permease [Pseudomonas fluorescens]MBT2314233.1 GntP family permease [Pseudomonas fluorescens]MBT2319275.1 GntP family permease [Pseudomonas fluorescens]MBT2327485.1 GntP family permease [Pseudomonas fluorescens]
MDATSIAGPQLMVSLVLAIVILIVLVLKTRIHALLALIIAASIAGLGGGMAPDALVKSITTGFGATLSTIGLVIGFGVMMGRLLEVSGAAERMAYTFVRWLGNKREEWAMMVTGYIVSVPIFCDSAFVILNPLVRALARNSGKSMLTLGIALASGLMLTHHAVPPTPGPLGIAGIFNIDVGLMIFWGVVFTIPGTFALVAYARFMGPRIEAMIAQSGQQPVEPATAYREVLERADAREAELPPLWLSMLPIVLPIVLIFANTLVVALGKLNGDSTLAQSLFGQIVAFVGNPVIAVGLGVVAAIYGLVPRRPREEVIAHMEKGVESAGIILLVTGAGGALGAVLRDSGAGQYMGEWVATLPLPAVLIPFVIASLVRLIQGSGTVAMITGASISAPILASIPDVNMVFAAQAAAIGSMVFGYFNDSYFWVVNRMLGVTNAKHQMLTWSVPTTIGWFTSLLTLLLFNAILG